MRREREVVDQARRRCNRATSDKRRSVGFVSAARLASTDRLRPHPGIFRENGTAFVICGRLG
jgi:hypothetical protein